VYHILLHFLLSISTVGVFKLACLCRSFLDVRMKCLVLSSNNTLCQFAAWIKMHLCSLLEKYAAGCLLWVSCTSLNYGFLSCLFITH
jgi:hypothetical protein